MAASQSFRSRKAKSDRRCAPIQNAKGKSNYDFGSSNPMQSAQRKFTQTSSEEYLQMEAQSPVKHEYIDGQIYAFAGASDRHVTIPLNLATLLRSHVRGSDRVRLD